MKTADCIVIGGGIMGCAAALRLAKAGIDTVVLERSIPGAEASSAAAGILAAQEEAVGPGALFELGVASRARFPSLAEELRDATGLDVGHRETGLVSVCFEARERDELERRYAVQRAAGHRVVWIDADALREREPEIARDAIGAMHFPDDGQVDPPALLRALSLAAAAAGARFVSGAHVRRVIHEGGRVAGVEVDGERFSARSVVAAAGSWSSLIDGGGVPPRAVRPMRGQIAQLETRPPAIRGTIVAHGGGYVVGRADGRVLAGSTMEQVGFDKRVTAAGVRHVLDVAIRLAPALADAPVTATWANFRPTTDDQLPVIGTTPIEGLVVATGHFRNGILLAPITAEIVRDLVTGAKPPIDLAPFSPGRLA